MAYSAGIKGFWYKKNLQPGVSKPATLRVPLANSAGPLTIGDAVQYTSGFLTIAATGESVLGILTGFCLEDGENVFKTNQVHGATLSGDDTLTASSSNQTRDVRVFGEVIVDKDALFLNEADSSLTQAEVGTYFDTTASSDQVTGSGGAVAQFQLIELVTVDSEGASANDLGLVRIAESQLYNDAAA
jgi:hypothetical protein